MELTDKQKARKDRILYNAELLFYKQGFYKLSITELTKLLHVSRSTIYENFGSKEGLVEAVVITFNDRLNTVLEDICKDKRLSTFNKFIKIANQQGQSIEGKECYKFMNDLKLHGPELYKFYTTERKTREKKYYKPLIKKGIREGLFDKKIDPDFLLQVYLNMGRMTGETDILEKSKLNKAEAMEALIKIFMNGSKKL